MRNSTVEKFVVLLFCFGYIGIGSGLMPSKPLITRSDERCFQADAEHYSSWQRLSERDATPQRVESHSEDRSRRQFVSSLATVPSLICLLFADPKPTLAFDLPFDVNKPRIGGLATKIRNSCRVMDELQRDLMQERWDLVEQYPVTLRSYIPVFTAYTDSAFPSDAPTDKGLRVALRYEVGRFFGSLERFKQAVARRALDEAFIAYSDMSLHLDRYLRVGGLYTYYDATISLEPYFSNISESSLVYADPKKDPPEVRDLVMITKGPDKGKTGIMIGLYPDGNANCVVKLDRYKGMREIRVLQRAWVGKRLGEQDPDDVFLMGSK